MQMKSLLLSVSAFCLPAVASGKDAQRPIVITDAGPLRGEVDADVASFKGIPFAAPPLASLRWHAPQPVTRWSNVRDATAFGPDCMQIASPTDQAPLRTTPSEDCLYLNIWRPSRPTAHMPVLVWIYGGGFMTGGASPAVYDGSAFARRGIVFVSFNYRLNRLGFFAHPALSAAREGPQGNYGLMDQQAALQWVRRNIAAFGGDPRRVTVFGESAGGISVLALLGAPAARGLFQRAAIMSGSGRDYPLPVSGLKTDGAGVPSAETVGRNFAEAQGIHGTDQAALTELRALPASKLMVGLTPGEQRPDSPAVLPHLYFDGLTLIAGNDRIMSEHRQAKVPVLVGANSADVGMMRPKTKDDLFNFFGPDSAQARLLYDPSGDKSLRDLTAVVGADRTMIEPADYIARETAAAGLPVWHYRFSYVAKIMRTEWSRGTPHSTELPFVFDTIAARYGSKVTPEDEKTARAANAYFANFAQSGNPNGPGLPVWAQYKATSPVLMSFTLNDGPRAGPDPWIERVALVRRAQDEQR
jgi:para-nitrobenzyl esterase